MSVVDVTFSNLSWNLLPHFVSFRPPYGASFINHKQMWQSFHGVEIEKESFKKKKKDKE